MNAINYRVSLNYSPLDFPSIMGLGESSVSYHSEPFLKNNKLLLTITQKYILIEVSNNKEHEVLAVTSVYEIPSNEIKNREDVYEFYKDAMVSLNKVYQAFRTELPTLFNISLPTPPIGHYQREIDRVFNLLDRRN
jgi:hypothetical protein